VVLGLLVQAEAEVQPDGQLPLLGSRRVADKDVLQDGQAVVCVLGRGGQIIADEQPGVAGQGLGVLWPEPQVTAQVVTGAGKIPVLLGQVRLGEQGTRLAFHLIAVQEVRSDSQEHTGSEQNQERLEIEPSSHHRWPLACGGMFRFPHWIERIQANTEPIVF
jgi:hypothetical protein